jgi:hypoxanthine-DNA glycosylase
VNVESHPYQSFIPNNAKHLLLGSFPAVKKENDGNNWYYSSPRNQFWPILETIYQTNLKTITDKKKLLSKLKIAMTDIILSCDRRKGNSLDHNLINITYNLEGVRKILSENNIKKIFFTSRFVEAGFKMHFKELIADYPKIALITLPSPSPRYAKLSLHQKIKIYKKLLMSHLPSRKNK